MINDVNACLPQQDLKSMDPWTVIVEAARVMAIQLNKPNKSCKKCHGRDYLGRRADTGEPIVCPCIFPKQESDREIGQVQYRPRNRAERRAQK